ASRTERATRAAGQRAPRARRRLGARARAAGAEEALALHLSEHQELEQRLLRVQAVLRLVPDDALRAVDHLRGDFLAAVRRQAVHEDRLLPRRAHHLGSDLPIAERAPALLVFGL